MAQYDTLPFGRDRPRLLLHYRRFPVPSLLSQCFNPSRRAYYGGMAIALIFATLFGALAIAQAFDDNYVVQDDVRQYVF